MKDRQFMTVLGLVIAAGLVMGLIAFRMTAGDARVATAAVGGNAAGGPASAPQSSSADAGAESQPAASALAPDAESQNGEPGPPAKDPPELQGPASGDLPQIAADPGLPDAPAAPSSDTPPQ